jgi:hypothetical protein
MTDEQGFRELAREMDIEAMRERLELAEKYFGLGCRAGILQALDDALRANDLPQLIETLAARSAPTVGGEQ